MRPRVFLHANGAVIFLASLHFYIRVGGPWWLFLALLLAPDIFMLGYLSGPRPATG
ncbi:MAG: DUF4260 family protein [Spirochaetes bacterium]|jgi:hypothetical protein|nr:DUF4260 family protein [Spirochaetota bacterium]